MFAGQMCQIVWYIGFYSVASGFRCNFRRAIRNVDKRKWIKTFLFRHWLSQVSRIPFEITGIPWNAIERRQRRTFTEVSTRDLGHSSWKPERDWHTALSSRAQGGIRCRKNVLSVVLRCLHLAVARPWTFILDAERVRHTALSPRAQGGALDAVGPIAVLSWNSVSNSKQIFLPAFSVS